MCGGSGGEETWGGWGGIADHWIHRKTRSVQFLNPQQLFSALSAIVTLFARCLFILR